MIERQLIPMIQEEQKRPYAKYYKKQLAKVNMEQMKELSNGPMDFQKALFPKKLKELL